MINRFKIIFCISLNKKAAQMSSLLFELYFLLFNKLFCKSCDLDDVSSIG